MNKFNTITMSSIHSYGIHLARALTKLVLERGYKPFVVIRPENDASRGLYTKLGFEKAYQTVRAVFTPFNQSIGTTNGSSTTNGKANGNSNGNTNGNSNGKTDSDEN
jgi:DNA-binding LacI/PurR family transcriptional regulator